MNTEIATETIYPFAVTGRNTHLSNIDLVHLLINNIT